VAASHPDKVVVTTPHGHRIDSIFTLLSNRRVQGELGPEIDGTPNSLVLVLEVDKELYSKGYKSSLGYKSSAGNKLSLL